MSMKNGGSESLRLVWGSACVKSELPKTRLGLHPGVGSA